MKMSFLFGKKHQDSVDYKSRLEYKLYLAREDPEPVFDLSECNLKTVPSGIYSLCKVFRKEKLSLQLNQLTSLSGGGRLSDLNLLTTLHLQHNCLSSLPQDISLLINLQELNVSHNKLCKLPDTIGKLKELQILDCAHNCLREVPSAVGEMVALTCLDLRHNPALQSLPDTLGRVTGLQQLLVDPDRILEPPSSVTGLGAASILRYLCLKNGTNYVLEQKELICEPKQCEDSLQLQGSFQLFEKKKDIKLQELMEVERQIQEEKGREFNLHETNKQDKNKLLLRLLEQQKKTEEDVTQFQIQKEHERARLLNYLQTVEKQAEETIADLLAVTKAVQSSSSQWQEQELQEQQLLLDVKAHTTHLQRTRVIEAMEELLMEECSHKERFHAYEKSRADLVHNSLLREVEWSHHISELVNERDVRQTTLLSTINADTQLQKTLVATLLERSDLRTQSLLIQTSLVQQQLAALTAAELRSKQQHSVELLKKLTKKREQLSDMLVGLLEQQQRRQKYLIDKLHQLELTCDRPDYWLWQYQCLLDLRPQSGLGPTPTTLEPDLVHQIVAAGVAHCLPFLLSCSLPSITPTLLLQIGVKDEEDRATIIRVVEMYLKQKEARCAPSAPPELPSAPPEPSSPSLPECIICMELECAVVFVPCGHLCACASCAAQLLLCPLCRAQIDRKIHIIIP